MTASAPVIFESDFEIIYQTKNKFAVKHDNQLYLIDVLSQFENRIELLVNGRYFDYTLDDRASLLAQKLGIKERSSVSNNELISPMPGLIKEIMVKKGDKIKKGDALVVLEAMKMENILKCNDSENTVVDIVVEVGQTVEKSTVLIKFND